MQQAQYIGAGEQPRTRQNRLAAAIRAAFVTLPMLSGPALAQTSGITDMGTLISAPGSLSFATGVSGDGSIVVGYGSGDPAPNPNINIYHAFKWSGSMTDLGVLPGATGESRAWGISADGSTIVGSSQTAGGNGHAVVWRTGGITDLGTLPGGTSSEARAASATGSVIVGTSQTTVGGNPVSHAFRYSGGVMQDLGIIGGSSSGSSGLAVSADGSVVVGYSTYNNNYNSHAFRWSGGTMQDLGSLGGTDSYGYGVSGDGSVVVGSSFTTGNTSVRAFRWTQAGGMVDLGTLGGSRSAAAAISSNGLVIVGGARNAAETTRAFRWTQATGMQSVEDWLRANGVTVASDSTFAATATNSDGSVVVGSNQSSHAFIARVVAGGGNSGGNNGSGNGMLVLDSTTASSLGSSSAVGISILLAQSSVVNGAHSRPLSYRVASGQKTFWAAGDWGRDDHGSRDGSVGLAEAGFGYNLGPWQINAALGHTWTDQTLVLNGALDGKGSYLMAEALAPITGKLWGVLSGYYNWGDADIRRGYLNAGTPDSSKANTDTRTWALRARLEWDGIASIGDASLNPYVDLTHAGTRIDAYTETGGGFPAAYAARKERVTDLRLGLNGIKPLSGSTRLVGVLEATHRDQERSARVTGSILGPGGFSFDLPGQAYKKDWARAGIGIESAVGGGTASLMLNATTESPMPNYWLAARYQLAF